MEGKLGKGAEAAKAHEARVEAQKAAFKKARRRDSAKQGGQGGKGGKQPSRPPKPARAPTTEELDARMLGALITGVRRAFPYVPSEDVEPLIEKHSSALFRWGRGRRPRVWRRCRDAWLRLRCCRVVVVVVEGLQAGRRWCMALLCRRRPSLPPLHCAHAVAPDPPAPRSP
jgi:hypothetical protein